MQLLGGQRSAAAAAGLSSSSSSRSSTIRPCSLVGGGLLPLPARHHHRRHTGGGSGSSSSLRRRRATGLVVRAENQEFGLAPAKPKTPYGEMLQYYLRMEPQLFRAAVDQQLARLRDERQAKEAEAEAEAEAERLRQQQQGGGAAAAAPSGSSGSGSEGGGGGDQPPPPQRAGSELVLRRRMEEVRALEVRAALEDLMYVSILEKFVVLGVEMLPRLDGFVDAGPANLVALTEGIHSREALELVREHMLGVMGAAASAKFSTELIKMSKFQMAQVYAASVMFGYFLRRVDRRFQLEAALGVSGDVGSSGLGLGLGGGGGGGGGAREDAVARLERLFAQADDLEGAPDPDAAGPIVDVMTSLEEQQQQQRQADAAAGGSSSSSSRAGGEVSSSSSGRRSGDDDDEAAAAAAAAAAAGRRSSHGRGALRRYIERFDQAAMVDTARVVSAEGAALVERQTTALFGDIKELTRQMQRAVGEVSSAEQLYARIQAAVQSGAIETVTMTVATQRRAVLEAVAFGTFLRDVESHVDSDYALLTPLPAPKLPPPSPEAE